MPRGLRRFAIACVVLLAAGDVRVQETGLACNGDVRDRSAETRLVPYGVTATSTGRLTTKPSWTFGPFSRREYGFDRVTFFIDEVGPFEQEQGGEYGPVDVVVRVEGAEVASFRVLPKDADSNKRGALNGYRGLAAVPDGQLPTETVRLATERRTIPLFAVGLGDADVRSTTTSMFLLDLRPARQRVPLTFACVSDVIAGACGAFDGNYRNAHESIDCQWSDSGKDFRCGIEERIEATWGAKVTTRHLPLPGQLDAGPAVERESTAQVERLAKRFVSKQGATLVDTGTWGPVHAIVAVPAETGGSLVLLARAGLSTRFGARFMLVKIDRNSRATVHPVDDVPIKPAYWRNFREVKEIGIGGRPLDSRLSFEAQRLAPSSDLKTLLRVRVRDGAASATYLIALDERPGSFKVGAMRLATDTSEYVQCGRALTPPNVFEVRRSPGGPFQAELQIEPPHEVQFDSDEPVAGPDRIIQVDVPQCPTTMTVKWDRGFRLEEGQTQPVCPAPSKSRFVEIRDDGTIVAVEQLKPKSQ